MVTKEQLQEAAAAFNAFADRIDKLRSVLDMSEQGEGFDKEIRPNQRVADELRAIANQLGRYEVATPEGIRRKLDALNPDVITFAAEQTLNGSAFDTGATSEDFAKLLANPAVAAVMEDVKQRATAKATQPGARQAPPRDMGFEKALGLLIRLLEDGKESDSAIIAALPTSLESHFGTPLDQENKATNQFNALAGAGSKINAKFGELGMDGRIVVGIENVTLITDKNEGKEPYLKIMKELEGRDASTQRFAG